MYRSAPGVASRRVSPDAHAIRGYTHPRGGSLELHGNTQGLKPDHARALKNLYRRRVSRNEFVSPSLARTLTELCRDTRRRIGVLLDRSGDVTHVLVGDAHRVQIPDLGARRAGKSRFRGLRLIHGQLRGEGLTEEDLTDLSLLQLDAVATITVALDGLPGAVHWAHLLPPDPASEGAAWRKETVRSAFEWTDDFSNFIADLEAQFQRSPHLRRIDGRPGALLVGATLGHPNRARTGLAELERLADTAGLQVLDRVLTKRDVADGRTYIGSGKLQEILLRSMHLGAEVLIFDRELAPSQLRNIAEATELKVLDRTQLILDIFSQHAETREGKLQVELAQLRYRMPRLAIMPTAMSRLTGGVGGRGPGETKLEINGRRARERQTRIERELEQLGRQRALRRRRRERNNLPVVSIVGYTNAGKSTLLNRMTNSHVAAADQLFATLDPTSRRFRFPEEREILLTDTVGFIQDLPDTLRQAFRATLEELEEADLLLHVLDAADLEVERHKTSVEAVVEELGLTDRAVLLAWNKADTADPHKLRELRDRYGGVAVSALTGEGTDTLLARIEHQLFVEGPAVEAARLRAAPPDAQLDPEGP